MATFRSAERRSPLRANVFLAECAAVLSAYLSALRRRLGSHDSHGRRELTLAAFGVVYMARLVATSRYLLKRELAVEEVTFVILVWVPSILASFAFLSDAESDLDPVRCVGATSIYLLGSFLNTYSEWQRKAWKERKANGGRCYTGGLFSLSRNVNYLGDVVLFGAWAAATGSWKNTWVPIAMAASFWFHHIPEKEGYLAGRYGRDWDDYVRRTPYALVPYVC